MQRRRLCLCGTSGLLAPAFGARAATEAPPVVPSFSLLADLVRELVPPGFEVRALASPDADAQVVKPCPADARRLAEADLMVISGLDFEGRLERPVRASGYRGPVVTASRDVALRRACTTIDPHAWLDVAQARREVATTDFRTSLLGTRWGVRARD